MLIFPKVGYVCRSVSFIILTINTLYGISYSGCTVICLPGFKRYNNWWTLSFLMCAVHIGLLQSSWCRKCFCLLAGWGVGICEWLFINGSLFRYMLIFPSWCQTCRKSPTYIHISLLYTCCRWNLVLAFLHIFQTIFYFLFFGKSGLVTVSCTRQFSINILLFNEQCMLNCISNLI